MPHPSKLRGAFASPSLHALRAAMFVAGALSVLVGVGVVLHQPLLIPPLAASAALVHGAPGLPTSQPRNLIGGQLLSALIGFGVLALTGPSTWGAAAAAGVSLGVMLFLGLSHSPAAATAVLVVLQAPPALPFLALLLLGTVLLVAGGSVAEAMADRALLQAAGRGDLAGVRAALGDGADTEARDEAGRTALLLASLADHVDVAQALVAAGVEGRRGDAVRSNRDPSQGA